MLPRLKSLYYNNRSLLYQIIGNATIKCIAVGVSIAALPIYMRYFDNRGVLGVWLVLLSMLTMVSVFDFGLGNGLRNRLTVALENGGTDEIRQMISSAYAVMFSVCAVIFLIGIALIPLFPWNDILGISPDVIRPETLLTAVYIVFTSVVLQMCLRLVDSILYALQKAAWVGGFPLFTTTCLLLYAWLSPGGDAADQSLLDIAAVYLCAANIPYIIATGVLFRTKLRDTTPSTKFVNTGMIGGLMRLGGLFFYLTVMSMIIHQTNEVLISALFSSSNVVEYQIYNKIFSFVIMAMNIMLIPLWSAVTKARAQGNIRWIAGLHHILCAFSLVGLFGALVITLCMQPIVDIWLRERAIQIVSIYCIPFVLYVTIDIINGANATIANGANWLTAQIWMAPITVLLNVGCTFFLSTTFGHWATIPLANVLSLLPIAIVQYVYIRRKLGKELQRGEAL